MVSFYWLLTGGACVRAHTQTPTHSTLYYVKQYNPAQAPHTHIYTCIKYTAKIKKGVVNQPEALDLNGDILPSGLAHCIRPKCPKYLTDTFPPNIAK